MRAAHDECRAAQGQHEGWAARWQGRADSALLRSWHPVLQDAASQPQSDHAAMLAALQPFVPADSSSAANCARLHFCAKDQPLTTRHALLYVGDIQSLKGLSKILEKASTAVTNLARRQFISTIFMSDNAGGLADLQAADHISPNQDFHYLKLPAERVSNSDTSLCCQYLRQDDKPETSDIP